MRTTDFCFPLPYLRVPAPRELPASLRGLRLAHGPRACTRDQETGGPGVSRCLIRFGGLRRAFARSFLPSALDRVEPLTPLSLPTLPDWAFASVLRAGLPRPLSSPLREDETIRSTRDAFHRWGALMRVHESVLVRVRSRDGFRYGPALSVRSLAILPAPLSRHRSYRSLDPRPRASSRLALSHEPSTLASLDQATAQRLLQLHFRRTDTPSSFRFSLSSGSRFETRPRTLHSPSPVFFRDERPSPLEEGPRMLRTATVLLTPPPPRCKHAESHDSRSYRPITTPLAGDALTRPSFAVTAVGRQR